MMDSNQHFLSQSTPTPVWSSQELQLPDFHDSMILADTTFLSSLQWIAWPFSLSTEKLEKGEKSPQAILSLS